MQTLMTYTIDICICNSKYTCTVQTCIQTYMHTCMHVYIPTYKHENNNACMHISMCSLRYVHFYFGEMNANEAKAQTTKPPELY